MLSAHELGVKKKKGSSGRYFSSTSMCLGVCLEERLSEDILTLSHYPHSLDFTQTFLCVCVGKCLMNQVWTLSMCPSIHIQENRGWS